MDPRLKQIWDYGHGVNFGVTEDDLEKLILIDSPAKSMVASWQDIMGLVPDSELGPITEHSLTLERCGMPDHAAAGQGTFNDPCFSEGIRFSFNDSRRPSSFSAADSDQMIADVVAAYAAIGARMIRVDPGDNETIRAYWEPLRGSTIGLAELTNGPCNQRLFCKLDPDYGSSGLVQMSALLCHEIGHNFGLGHSSGGIMSPSIVQLNSFGGWRKSDPSYSQLERWYGGDPIDPPPVTPDAELTFTISSGLLTIRHGEKDFGDYIPVINSGQLVDLKKWEGV